MGFARRAEHRHPHAPEVQSEGGHVPRVPHPPGGQHHQPEHRGRGGQLNGPVRLPRRRLDPHPQHQVQVPRGPPDLGERPVLGPQPIPETQVRPDHVIGVGQREGEHRNRGERQQEPRQHPARERGRDQQPGRDREQLHPRREGQPQPGERPTPAGRGRRPEQQEPGEDQVQLPVVEAADHQRGGQREHGPGLGRRQRPRQPAADPDAQPGEEHRGPGRAPEQLGRRQRQVRQWHERGRDPRRVAVDVQWSRRGVQVFGVGPPLGGGQVDRHDRPGAGPGERDAAGDPEQHADPHGEGEPLQGVELTESAGGASHPVTCHPRRGAQPVGGGGEAGPRDWNRRGAPPLAPAHPGRARGRAGGRHPVTVLRGSPGRAGPAHGRRPAVGGRGPS